MGSNKSHTCHVEIKGAGKSHSEEIDLFPFVIGRGEDADIRIAASGISRSHISVSIREGSLWIEDLASANGTFLNEKKLDPHTPTRHKDGDIVKLGLNQDILTFKLLEEKVPEHHAVQLPPLPIIPSEPKAILRVKVKPSEVKIPEVKMQPVMAEKPIEIKPVETKPLEGTIIDPNYKTRGKVAEENLQKEALEEAKAAALRIKITAETEAAKIIQMAKEMGHTEVSSAREKAAEIISKATDQSFRLQKEGEAEATKMRQAMQDTISKLHLESEEKAEASLKEARHGASTIKANAQQEADGIISKAYQKVLDSKTQWEDELKALQKEEKKKGTIVLDAAQAEADKILEEAHGASLKLRENIERELDEIKERAERAALKNSEEIIRSANAEAKKIKSEATKAAEKLSHEIIQKEKEAHLAAHEKENKALADSILRAQSSIKLLNEEKDELQKNITQLKKKETKLSKELDEQAALVENEKSTHAQAIEKEAREMRASVEKERQQIKTDIENETKKLQEKGRFEFLEKQAILEKEYAKTRILEISKALETFIIPRIKETLNWEEIPKTFNNFSNELHGIIKKVMDGDFSEVVADTAMDVSIHKKSSSSRARTLLYLTLGSGTAVLAFMNYGPIQDEISNFRKPASIPVSKPQIHKLTLPTTDDYKPSYTDNVLYTKDYVALKLSPKNQADWALSLDSFFSSQFNLSEKHTEDFISIESNLVHQLADIRSSLRSDNEKESVLKMATLEKDSVSQFISVLGGKENYNTFRDFEKNYLEKRRVPSSKN